MADWFVTINGVEKGPYNAEQIRAGVNKGKIDADTLIRKDGMSKAVPAGTVKGLIKSGADAGTGTQRRRRKERQGAEGTGRRSKQRQKGTGKRRKQEAANVSDELGPSDHGMGRGTEEAALPESGPAFDAFAKDDDYVKHIEKHKITDNYFIEALKAFIFPLSINAIAFLLGYVALGLIFVYGGIFLINAWSGFHYIFFFLVIWFIMYGFAYLQRIGQRSAEGDMKAPVWPELGAMLEEIIGPAAVMIGAFVILKLPYFIVAWSDPAYLPQSTGLVGILNGVDTYLFHAFDLMVRLPEEGVHYIMQLLSWLIFPIGMLFVMVKGGFLGLNPGPLFKTLFTIMPEYFTCLALMLVSHVAMMLIFGEVAAAYGLDATPCFAYMVFVYFPSLGFVDVLCFLALSIIPAGYLMMVQFRLMGLIYCTKSDKFL